jgi:hypothetical protein
VATADEDYYDATIVLPQETRILPQSVRRIIDTCNEIYPQSSKIIKEENYFKV